VSDSAITRVTVGGLPRGSARLGVVALGLPGFANRSRFVTLRKGDRKVVCRTVWLFDSSHPAEDEAWLDEWQREDLGAGPGDQVELVAVPAGQVIPLSQVQLTGPAPLPPSVTPGALAGFMARKHFPLYPGFRFEFSPLGTGESLVFEVNWCRGPEGPVDFGIAEPETTVRVHAGGGELAVSYDDLGGLDSEIKMVRETVELPMRMRRSARRLGVSPPRGVIFHGPPGTGKTLLARALANAAGVPISFVNPSELASRFAGQAEQKMNDIFDRAEAHAEGAVIVIDELDALAGKREGAGASASAGLLEVLLVRLSGLASRGNVVVIGTTNRLGALDEAVRRHGRFSREIHVPAPNEAGRLQVLQIHSRGMPLAEASDEDREQLLRRVARQTRGFVGADLVELCREAGLSALRRAHPLAVMDQGEAAPQDDLTVTAEDFEQALRLIRPSALKEVLVCLPDVSFADIAGLGGVVAEIRERIISPLQHPEAFAAMRLPAERGILLYGPPGTGKTMLAKAVARECGANFLVVQGPELLSKWVGDSEEGVRRVFARARQLAPAVIFFDEIEALLPARGRHQGDSGVSDRVVNQFLAEMDGVVELRGVTVIGATNRPELLDPAALRPGRLGTHILVPLPDETGRLAILRLYLGSGFSGEWLGTLARETQGFSGADLAAVCQDARRIALREAGYAHAVPVTQAHLSRALELSRLRRQPGLGLLPDAPGSRRET
jgi:transitional endoplasmic reticulum ATPase